MVWTPSGKFRTLDRTKRSSTEKTVFKKAFAQIAPRQQIWGQLGGHPTPIFEEAALLGNDSLMVNSSTRSDQISTWLGTSSILKGEGYTHCPRVALPYWIYLGIAKLPINLVAIACSITIVSVSLANSPIASAAESHMTKEEAMNVGLIAIREKYPNVPVIERSFEAKLSHGIWVVYRTAPKGVLGGGGPVAEIRDRDRKLIRIYLAR